MEWVLPIAVMAGIVALFAAGRRPAADPASAARLAEIERKLDLLLAHLDIRVPEPEAPPGVLEELYAGRKILAVKAYRAATGAGLKDAKDAVEEIARRHSLPG